MGKLFNGRNKYFSSLSLAVLLLANMAAAAPAQASFASLTNDLKNDAELAGLATSAIGNNLANDLSLIGGSFFDSLERLGANLAVGGDSFFDGWGNFVGNLGNSLALASDSFFDGSESLGHSLASISSSFFDGVDTVSTGLAFVGETIGGVIFKDAGVAANQRSSLAALTPVPEAFTVIPSGDAAEPEQTIQTFDVIQSVDAVLPEPVPLQPIVQPVSAVAGLKVVSNNLVLNPSSPINEAESDDANYYLGSGRAHMNNNNFSAAQTDFEKALALDSSAISTYAKLADAHELSGNLEGAIAAMERGLAKGGRTSDSYLQHVGRLYFKRHTLNDLIVAERAFQEALLINPQSREAIFALGAIAEAKDNAVAP